MNTSQAALDFCASTPITKVVFTSEEWIMIAFVCAIVFFFTGKRLLADIKGWIS